MNWLSFCLTIEEMAVNLSKGQKVDLTKGNPGLQRVVIGLGWDTNKYDGGHAFDLDSSAFLTDASGKVTSDADFVFTTIYSIHQRV